MSTETDPKNVANADTVDNTTEQAPAPQAEQQAEKPANSEKEVGGPAGLEPTRYGDWERKGICVDF